MVDKTILNFGQIIISSVSPPKPSWIHYRLKNGRVWSGLDSAHCGLFPLYFGKDLQGDLAAGWSCIITAVGNSVGIIKFLWTNVRLPELLLYLCPVGMQPILSWYRWGKSQNKTCWWFPVSYSLYATVLPVISWKRYHSPSRCTGLLIYASLQGTPITPSTCLALLCMHDFDWKEKREKKKKKDAPLPKALCISAFSGRVCFLKISTYLH